MGIINGIKNSFNFRSFGKAQDTELPVLFPLGITEVVFVNASIKALFCKIMFDCYDRSNNFNKKFTNVLFDSCLYSEVQKGLISLMADAYTNKSDLYLVFKAGVLRLADTGEKEKILGDYIKQNKSKVGIYISFKYREEVNLLRIYMMLKYLTILSSNVMMNIAKSTQIKIDKLRDLTQFNEREMALAQARTIADGFKTGKSLLLDKNDEIVTSTVDMVPTQTALDLIYTEIAGLLNFPEAYITGKQSQGLSTTGEGDTRAIERGLRAYFNSIFAPVCKELFNMNLEFKSDDFGLMDSSIRAVVTLTSIPDELVSVEDKKRIINRSLNIEEQSDNL